MTKKQLLAELDSTRRRNASLETTISELRKTHSVVEERYQNLFNNADDGLFQTTPDGRILAANNATARILGYESVDELLSLVTDVQTQVHVTPESRDKVLSGFQTPTIFGFRTPTISGIWGMQGVRSGSRFTHRLRLGKLGE